MATKLSDVEMPWSEANSLLSVFILSEACAGKALVGGWMA